MVIVREEIILTDRIEDCVTGVGCVKLLVVLNLPSQLAEHLLAGNRFSGNHGHGSRQTRRQVCKKHGTMTLIESDHMIIVNRGKNRIASV